MVRRGFKPLVVGTLALIGTVGWLALPAAQKRTTSSVEPFQTSLTIVVPANDQNAIGTATFQVPAGKRLNLRYLTLEHGMVARVQIDTTVDGITVTHNLINNTVIDHPIYLWADDTGPVTVRIFRNTATNAPETWPASLTGELF